MRLCVEYYCAHGVPAAALMVVLNENRKRHNWDEHMAHLDTLGVIAWTPTAKDDDVFLLTAAANSGAWVVTNDHWRDHRAARHVTEAVHRRVNGGVKGRNRGVQREV